MSGGGWGCVEQARMAVGTIAILSSNSRNTGVSLQVLWSAPQMHYSLTASWDITLAMIASHTQKLQRQSKLSTSISIQIVPFLAENGRRYIAPCRLIWSVRVRSLSADSLPGNGTSPNYNTVMFIYPFTLKVMPLLQKMDCPPQQGWGHKEHSNKRKSTILLHWRRAY